MEKMFGFTSVLLKEGLSAKLIQSNDGFNLFNLIELRSFMDDLGMDKTKTVITMEAWDQAKRNFKHKHGNSSNYELCKNLLVDFQEINPKVKYTSDFEVFIKESKLEDFMSQSNEIIIVSTIHKAKGKEFDNVFLLLDGFKEDNEEAKRQLYVAMTRDKKNLTIHYNGHYLEAIQVEQMRREQYPGIPTPPIHLVYHLSHRDIYLDYFNFIQSRIATLKSGDSLKVNDQGLVSSNNEQIVKFSKTFQEVRFKLEKQGYQLVEAKIRFILYWERVHKDTGEKKEIKIVLPELYFEKKKNLSVKNL